MFEAIISVFGVGILIFGSFSLHNSARKDYRTLQTEDDHEAIDIIENLGKQTWVVKNKEIQV